MKTLTVKLIPCQESFILSKGRYPAFVAGWGVGKTMMMVGKAVELCNKYPNNRGLIVRKDWVDLRDSTQKDFELYTGMKINSNKEVIFPNGSVLMFRHAAELEGLQNINLGFFGMEQADEFDSDKQFTMLRGRLRLATVTEHKGMVIGNTNGHNWIWQLWKVNSTQDVEFTLSEATSFDNEKNLPAKTIEDWRKMEAQQPEAYRRFIMNSWDEEDTIAYVIPDSMIRPCINLEQGNDERTLVSVDPAYGGDRCPIYGFKGTRRVEQLILRKDLDEKIICGHINGMKNKIRAMKVVGDAIGNGHGIFTELDHQGIPTHKIISSQASENPAAYANIRAEMWWTVRNMFLNHEINMVDDSELIAELSAMKYIPNSKNVIKLEAKEEVKKRIGKSPDLADCFVMGIYALTKIKRPEVLELERQRQPKKRMQFSGRAGWVFLMAITIEMIKLWN